MCVCVCVYRYIVYIYIYIYVLLYTAFFTHQYFLEFSRDKSFALQKFLIYLSFWCTSDANIIFAMGLSFKQSSDLVMFM